MKKLWEVKSEIKFPMQTIGFGADGSFPEKLEHESKAMFGTGWGSDDCCVFLERWTGPASKENLIAGIQYESVALICRLQAENFGDALEGASPHIEWACDQLAFYAQVPMPVVSQLASEVGADSHHAISGNQSVKFRHTMAMNVRVPKLIPLVERPANFTG